MDKLISLLMVSIVLFAARSCSSQSFARGSFDRNLHVLDKLSRKCAAEQPRLNGHTAICDDMKSVYDAWTGPDVHAWYQRSWDKGDLNGRDASFFSDVTARINMAISDMSDYEFYHTPDTFLPTSKDRNFRQ